MSCDYRDQISGGCCWIGLCLVVESIECSVCVLLQQWVLSEQRGSFPLSKEQREASPFTFLCASFVWGFLGSYFVRAFPAHMSYSCFPPI